MAEVPLIAETGVRYRRHHPEQTLLYQLVEQYYPEFVELLRMQERPLPTFVQCEFEAFLKCGRLKYGFLKSGTPTATRRSWSRSAASVAAIARAAAPGE